MTISHRFHILRLPLIGLALIVAMATASTASAQVSAADLPEVEIDRDADALRDEIRPRIKDIDLIDTVLVFTNTQSRSRPVRCLAFNRGGEPVGRTLTRLPANGVRYILASDLSNGRDFVGHVVCNTVGLVLPTGILLGPEIENVGATVDEFESAARLRFPVVATY
jgi:hypothetical protein